MGPDLRLPLTRSTPLEPATALARLRRDSPVARVTGPSGAPAWLVTDYATARRVLTDPRCILGVPGSASADMRSGGSLFQDPPGHTRLRRLVSAAFTTRRVGAMRSRIGAVAVRLCDELADELATGREVDLMEAFALPLPITVIGEVLGVPPEGRANFRSWSDALLALPTAGAGATGGQGAGWQNLAGQVAELIAHKRRHPGDDLLSDLIAVRDADDDRLFDEELLMMVLSLIPAGYVTTSTVLGVGVLHLTAHGALARLAGDPTVAGTAVEEVLRYQCVVGDVARVAAADLTVEDTPVRAGDTILVSLTSANRDPRSFAEPDRFDLARRDAHAHLTFGHGIHHCLGAALARLELRVAFTTLAARIPTLHPLAAGLAWQRSDLFGDEILTTLPICTAGAR